MKVANTCEIGREVLISAFMSTLIASSTEAGLKYWNTGSYDADSYV